MAFNEMFVGEMATNRLAVVEKCVWTLLKKYLSMKLLLVKYLSLKSPCLGHVADEMSIDEIFVNKMRVLLVDDNGVADERGCWWNDCFWNSCLWNYNRWNGCWLKGSWWFVWT